MNNNSEKYNQAKRYYSEKKFNKSAKLYLELAEFEEKIGRFLESSIFYDWAASSLEKSGQLDSAIKFYNHALNLGIKLKDLQRNSVRNNNIGKVFEIKGEIETAIEYYRKAIALNLITNNLMEKIRNQNNLASALQIQGKLDEAIGIFNDIIDQVESMDNFSQKSTIINNLGTIYQEKGDLEKALDYFQQALEIDEANDDEKSKAIRLSNIGTIYLNMGEFEKALDYYQSSLIIFERINAYGNCAISSSNIGSIYIAKGDYKKAMLFLLKSFEINNSLGIKRNSASNLRKIGTIFHNQKNYDKALQFFQKAHEISTKINELKNIAYSRYKLGRLYQQKGDLEGAIAFYKSALDLNQKLVEGEEISHKEAHINCPSKKCDNLIELNFIGEQGATIQICQKCMVQFSVWMMSGENPRYFIRILSEDYSDLEFDLMGRLKVKNVEGKKSKELISEWLLDGAIFSYYLGQSLVLNREFKEAFRYLYQSATRYRAVGLMEKFQNVFEVLEILIKILESNRQEYYKHQLSSLKKQHSEILRSQKIKNIVISCPVCHYNYKIRMDDNLVTIEHCYSCNAKYSIYYDEENGEFYTNLIETPKNIRSIQNPNTEELVSYCMQCGTYVGQSLDKCSSCGFKIIRF